jgi:L-lactate permease
MYLYCVYPKMWKKKQKNKKKRKGRNKRHSIRYQWCPLSRSCFIVSLSRRPHFTVTLSYRPLYELGMYCDWYLYTRQIREKMYSYTFIVSSCNDCWIKMICFDVISLKCFAGVFLHQTRTLIRYYWHVFGKYKYIDMLSVFCTSAKNNHCFLYEILNN